ncbi:MAG: hypothetical protein SGI73_22015 [Chloroflexota bacterium]|nr:hypothetical protein [Chloroflexota bacterium]
MFVGSPPRAITFDDVLKLNAERHAEGLPTGEVAFLSRHYTAHHELYVVRERGEHHLFICQPADAAGRIAATLLCSFALDPKGLNAETRPKMRAMITMFDELVGEDSP